MFSVLILTLDEEANIERCIRSVSGCDDVVVLDSMSTDGTAKLAAASGARVVFREFDNYAAQRNYGLKEIQYLHDWVLMLDADEEADVALVTEIKQRIFNCDDDVGLMRLRRKDFFLGKWIKHSSSYPLWFGRVMRPDRVWVEREINEEFHTDGTIEHLDSHINHYPFNKGFSAWLQKHDRYSTMEARLKTDQAGQPFNWRGLASGDPTLRRKSLKQLVYSLPGRPLIVFVGLYFIKGGILEGRAGFVYCSLKMFYEFMISCKLIELRYRSQDRPV